jgi:hypothetical protein
MPDRHDSIVKEIEKAKGSEFGVTAVKIECEGQLRRAGDFRSVEFCHNWIMGKLAEHGLAEFIEGEYIQLAHGTYTQWHTIHPLRYAEFYRDGSVDSELTATVMLDNPENAFYLPKIAQAFKDLAEENGNGLEVSGAGLHMAWIRSDNGVYPSAMPDAQVKRFGNFKKSMTMLLPALFFLGTSNDQSRGLGYRRPVVGIETHRSAIDYRSGALEFRLFDTCYDNLDAIMDNMVVMSKCMKYWRATYMPSGVEKISNRTSFGNDRGDKLDRMYMTITHINLLNAGLTRLKPDYYTVKELKKMRKFENDKRKLKTLVKDRERKAHLEYKEYEERFDWRIKALKSSLKQEKLMEMSNLTPIDQLRRLEIGEAAQTVEEQIEPLIEEQIGHKQQLVDYVTQKLDEFNRQSQGEFTISV